jgi:SRSO17 transposase
MVPMNGRKLARVGKDLGVYLDELFSGQGRTETRVNLGHYARGLLLDGERKSMQPMAQRLAGDEGRAEAIRQRLQQGIAVCPWDDELVFQRLVAIAARSKTSWQAWVIDDTGFPKKGKLSVGVHRQYSGTLGRVENCQVAVSVHLARESSSVCGGMRLFLPAAWCDDAERAESVGVPGDIAFQEKWRIALSLLDNARLGYAEALPVLADAGYGCNGLFRQGLRDRGLEYVVAVKGETVVWPPEAKPKIPPPSAVGRRLTRHVDPRHPPESIANLASRLRFRKVTWRQGSKGMQSSRFAACRVKTAHRHVEGHAPGPQEWLLCEWPKSAAEPTKFYLSSLPATMSVRKLVAMTKLRWRVERDYQEMKQELGLDHFEGRTWRGFHHHVTLCAVAHAFIALHRGVFSPEQETLAA